MKPGKCRLPIAPCARHVRRLVLGSVALGLVACAAPPDTASPAQPLVSRADQESARQGADAADATAPRFIQTLALCDATTLQKSRAALLAELQIRLAVLRHVRREASSPGGIEDVPETLASCQYSLSRCDLLNIHLLLTCLERPVTSAEILRLGLEDRADTSTEHGGVLSLRGSGELAITVIPPMYPAGDREYITPDQTLAAIPTSLALFHFHFDQVDNAENAGPGVGDLRFAQTHQTTCVVFTSLDARSFDVDYYNPQGAVVDLGVYHVPD